MLQRRVLEHRFGVSRMRSRTLGQMLCKHDAARGFASRMTGKAQKPPAILERYDHVTGDPLDVAHLAPRNAEIEGAAEFQPTARQDEMAVLISPPAAEADRRHVMTFIARRERVGRRGRRPFAAAQTVGEFGRLQVDR